MIQVSLTAEQLLTCIHQLPEKEKEVLLDDLMFEKWLNSPEAHKLIDEREQEFKDGKTMTIDQLREKLRAHGKAV